MANVIDTRNAGGELVVLGGALVLPTNALTITNPMIGSLRFNTGTLLVETYVGSGTWQVISNAGNTSATAAANSANQAAASATAASNSASSVSTSATNAANSATAAANSATTSANSAGTATTQATNAANSATAAANSATAASTNGTNAANAVVVAQPGGFTNLILNGKFNVNQRGSGTWTTTGSFTSDRWLMAISGSTATVSVAVQNDSGRNAIGDDTSELVLSTAFTGTSGAGDYVYLQQAIEDIRRLSGKTITVSFWVYGATATSIGVRVYQYFGTGGSPSATVSPAAATIPVTGTWTRKSATFTLASTSGKTLGTNSDHSTVLQLSMSSGSSNSASLGVGVQSGTILLWGVQIEAGSTVTALENRSLGDDLASCQRYYQAGQEFIAGYNAAASGSIGGTRSLSVSMRVQPTIVLTNNYSSNGTITLLGLGVDALYFYGNSAAVGNYSVNFTYTAGAEL